jgi:hypothetical protein
MQQPKKHMLSNSDPRSKEEAADLTPLSSTKVSNLEHEDSNNGLLVIC